MKVILGILAAVITVGLGLFLVFKFTASSATKLPTGSAPAAAPQAAPKPQPTDKTAQRIGAVGDLLAGLGQAGASVGLKLG